MRSQRGSLTSDILRTAVLIVVALLAGSPELKSDNATAAARQAAQKRTFTDAQILDGFLKTTFGAEFQTGTYAYRIRKFDGPVRVFIDGHGKPDRREALQSIVLNIKRLVGNLDIAVTPQREEANVIVNLVRDQDLTKTIRARYGQERARRIQRSLQPQCLSSFQKDESYRIINSEVILVIDAGDFVFYDCAYEEVLQALGPINDTHSVPWTMFNDDVQMGFFDLYDQHIMNMLYDHRIKPGMTRDEVMRVMPDVLQSARAFVANVNAPPR